MDRRQIHTNDDNAPTNRTHRVIIIGAGLNGLAAAHELKKIGAEPVILDASDKPAAIWRNRHDQLRLNTHRLISYLPGTRMPRRFGAFPARDDVVQYLVDYERRLDVPVHRNVRVRRIDPHDAGWRVTASDGTRFAQNVVIATGNEAVPVVPAWPGRDTFTGELIHSAHFGRVDRFKDKRVLVVGAGNSGVDVLNHLIRIETNKLWVSVRNGPAILPAKVLGLSIQLISPLMMPLSTRTVDFLMAQTQRMAFGDLKKYHLAKHPDGVATRLIKEDVAPAFDDGFVAALKAGRVTVLPEIDRLDGDTVHLADGRTVRPDVVICATGYRSGLEPMVGHLGVLKDNGKPRYSRARSHPDFQGLWFMGLTPLLPGIFYTARHEAAWVATAIKKKKTLNERVATVPSPVLSAL